MSFSFTISEICRADFRLHENNPLIRRFGVSPIIADPSVISPDVSHDGKWHLFAHTILGIYALESKDGLNFGNRRKIVSAAMRPDVKRFDGIYYLYYERTQPLLIKGLTLLGLKWRSHIEVITSTDLITWSNPVTVLKCDADYEKSERGISLSNPFLLKLDNTNRLYYSCGLTFIKDCGFSEPTNISFAESTSKKSDFVKYGKPIFSPDKESEYLNLCCGCLKVYAVKDGFIGLQNGIYFDRTDNKSKSAIILLSSLDGITFKHEKILIAPSVCGGNEWMAQYVYASSLAEYNGKLYLYFNARNASGNLKATENIGLATAKP